MITVNLLPTRELKRRAALRRQLYLAGGILGAALLVIVMLWSQDARTVDQLEVEQRVLRAELARLKKIVEEVNILETRQKLLRTRLETIQQLRRDQTGPVRMLDELGRGLPDQAWLEALEEKAGVYQASGYAQTNFAVADLLKNLQRSKEFGSVDLVSSELAVIEGEAIKKFIIQFRRNGDAGRALGAR